MDASRFKPRDDDFTGLAFAMALMYPGQFKQMYPEINHAHWLDACQRKLDLCQSAPSTTPINPGPRKLFLVGGCRPAPSH